MPRIRVAVRLKPETADNLLESLAVRKHPSQQSQQSAANVSNSSSAGTAAAGGGGGGLDVLELAVEGQRYDFSYDRVFDEFTTQEKVFEECAVMISDDVIEGYNGCIFAYGQTGAGKTYTMSGPTSNEYTQRGLVTRTISYLFEKSRQLAPFGDNISLRLSVLEIYNEALIDLLRADNPTTIGNGVAYSSSMAPAKQQQQLQQQQGVVGGGRVGSATGQQQLQQADSVGKLNVVDTPSGPIIPSLFVLPLASEEEANSLILEAYSNRVVAEHQLNKRSSRSHVLYTIYVTRTRMPPHRHTNQQHQQQQAREPEPEVSQSKLHLVDLAGSERVVKTGSAGVVQREANYINKSLSFLEQVVLALTQSKRDHIPYRQSKLTFILKDSLGGNSNTYMIACIWPHVKYGWETLSTLRFSSRMSTIENTPIRNNLVDRSDAAPSARLLQQLDALKRELVMRDMICGRDPWLPVLTPKQRDVVFAQVSEVVTVRPPAGSAFRGSTLLSADNNNGSSSNSSSSHASSITAAGSGNSIDVCVQSLSHVRLLMDCMKQLVWEACGNDSNRVNEIIQKVIPGAAVNTTAAATTDTNNSNYNFKSDKGSPSKRNAGLSIDVPSVLARSMSDKSPLQAAKYQSQSEQKPKQDHLQSSSNNNQPFSAQPKMHSASHGINSNNINNNNNRDNNVIVDRDRWEDMVGNSGMETPMKPDGAAAVNSIAAAFTFDEFKMSEQGIELHNAYEECKITLKNNKQYQKDLVAMINSVKSRIDTTATQLQLLKERALEINYKLQAHQEQQEQQDQDQNLEDGSNHNSESIQQLESELQALQLQIIELETIDVEAKKEYRAAHSELQASKAQAQEAQIIKQRAMAALVGAYDAACSH
jgi:hypothetical protein